MQLKFIYPAANEIWKTICCFLARIIILYGHWKLLYSQWKFREFSLFRWVATLVIFRECVTCLMCMCLFPALSFNFIYLFLTCFRIPALWSNIQWIDSHVRLMVVNRNVSLASGVSTTRQIIHIPPPVKICQSFSKSRHFGPCVTWFPKAKTRRSKTRKLTEETCTAIPRTYVS